jgi:hypothetical protein
LFTSGDALFSAVTFNRRFVNIQFLFDLFPVFRLELGSDFKVLFVCGVVPPRAASLNPASHLIGVCVAMSLFEQVLAFGLESLFSILFMEISDVGASAK